MRTLIAPAAVALLFALAACGENTPAPPAPPDPGEPELQGAEAAPADEAAPAASEPAPVQRAADARFPQEYSDIAVDEAVRYGELDNGLRYAILENDTPTGTAALRLRFDTGSLMESEEQRGLAHFLEHMSFNGSENVPETEMVKILERHGLAFGADTNAYTSFGETVYMLDLPETDTVTLDTSFMLMGELNSLLLEDDAIDRERGVVLSEMRGSNTPSYRAAVMQYDFLFPDLLLSKRFPIGEAEVLENAGSGLFRDLYERYYTPERAFFAAVGDFDADEIEARIAETFGDWEQPAEPGPDPNMGEVSERGAEAVYFQDPAIPTSIDVNIVTPAENPVDSEETRRRNVLRQLANAIVSRRMAAIARAPDAPFVQGRTSFSEFESAADVASVTVYVEPENWREGLTAAEHEVRRALEHGFTEAELAEQVANLSSSLRAAAEQADTRQSGALASALVAAFGEEQVFSHPRAALERFEAYADSITTAEVEAMFREDWDGGGPLIFMTGSEDIENASETILAAWQAAAEQPVEAPDDTEGAEFAYANLGEPGEVVSREAVEDLGAVLIRFDNNVRLNFKQTDFERDSVLVAMRFGDGVLGTPADRPALHWVASNALVTGGTQAHTLDELESLMAGRIVSVGFGAGTDVYSAQGRTIPADLETQLQVWAGYLLEPAFRPEAVTQFQQRYAINYNTLGATPGSVLARDFGPILYDGDMRHGYPPVEDMAALTAEDARAAMADALSSAAIEVTIVGDISEEAAVQAVAGTLGALPDRRAEPDALEAELPDFPDPELITLRHEGEPDQALAMVMWPTPDGEDVVTARELTLLYSALQIRVTDEIREELGATYSPGVSGSFGRDFPGYGTITVRLEVEPDNVDEVFGVVDEIAADFAAGNISEDEFTRARRPILEGVEEEKERNGYWLSVLSEAQTRPDVLDRHRSKADDYESVTLDQVKSLAAAYLDPEAALRVQVLPPEG